MVSTQPTPGPAALDAGNCAGNDCDTTLTTLEAAGGDKHFSATFERTVTFKSTGGAYDAGLNVDTAGLVTSVDGGTDRLAELAYGLHAYSDSQFHITSRAMQRRPSAVRASQ